MTGGEVDIVRTNEIKGVERHIFLVGKRSLNDWARLGSSNYHYSGTDKTQILR